MLETVSGFSGLGTRFLPEFERGKETAEIGKVLKALRNPATWTSSADSSAR